MPCTEFEDLLSGYADLDPAERRRADAHVLNCDACRTWLEALAEIDAALAFEFKNVHAPARLAVAVQHRVAESLPERVTAVPEILDFVGWLGVICAAGLLAYFLIPPSYMVSAPILYALSGIVLCLALSVTVWVLRSSEG